MNATRGTETPAHTFFTVQAGKAVRVEILGENNQVPSLIKAEHGLEGSFSGSTLSSGAPWAADLRSRQPGPSSTFRVVIDDETVARNMRDV